ncbi:hypothetical protein MPTK1_1g28020 [Marchantia polymorpha subsp. ruderalis]|uniref:Uncharacterized protein n=2 Tax=Marchantia polymorpha TaxID=3197 RepID=A0AAF6AV33_MARPO|nr:hypothetical protein MARPO_0002s0076 [Marchantia polymorpha]BBN00304.1 hypothetical protein Mp_1g28020 [Marchantia polymorpha subsp. ruderalis]|eukprot:PTQ49579.1 hypothetical protein MARPO_0002s0076 [Marchantia polymorpha]
MYLAVTPHDRALLSSRFPLSSALWLNLVTSLCYFEHGRVIRADQPNLQLRAWARTDCPSRNAIVPALQSSGHGSADPPSLSSFSLPESSGRSPQSVKGMKNILRGRGSPPAAAAAGAAGGPQFPNAANNSSTSTWF